MIIGDPDTSRYIDSCYVDGNVGSDHLPVITCLCFKVEKIQEEKVNLIQWAKNLDEMLIGYKVDSNIDKCINSLNAIVHDAKIRNTVKFDPKKRKLPREILQNIQLRKTLLRNRKKSASDITKKVLTKA